MLQRIFGYKVELVEHCPEYTLVRADKAVNVGTQIPVKVSDANGQRTPAVPMIVLSCRPSDDGGFLLTGRFLVEHPDLSGFEIPQRFGSDSALRADHRVNCHLCVISRELPGYRVMTVDISEGGLQVEAPSRVALGSSVLLRLEFDTEKLPAITATASVAWCSKLERGRYRIGLQFKSLDDHSAKVIGLYRTLTHKRAQADVAKKSIKDELDFADWNLSQATPAPTLEVLHWHDIPLFENARIVGYRRAGDELQLRIRGGYRDSRVCDFHFSQLKSLQDNLSGDSQKHTASEFRFAESGSGLFRFQFLKEDKTVLFEVEAADCVRRSPEEN